MGSEMTYKQGSEKKHRKILFGAIEVWLGQMHDTFTSKKNVVVPILLPDFTEKDREVDSRK